LGIYIGTQGFPLTTRGKSISTSMYRLSELGLNALELDFVHGIYLDKEEISSLAYIARETGIRLSIHAPYYINLCSEDKGVLERSKRRILACARVADVIGADIIAVHTAFYGRYSKEQAYDMIRDNYQDIIDAMNSTGIDVTLGAETMARNTQFGTLDELLRLYKDLNGHVKPYIDFAHMFIRNNGKIDYGYILDTLTACGIRHINSHFTGITKRGYRYVDKHAPIGIPPFEPLALDILRRNISITIICESPLLELDALRMRSMIEFIGMEIGKESS
jgi:deoxyribonuclease-4